MQFDHLGVFAYSPEEGTAGALMKGRPPMKVAQARALKIMAAQKKIWDGKAKSMLGQELPALVVSPGIARLESQAPDVDGVVRLTEEDAAVAPVGEFVLVRLVKVLEYDFIGELV
jgi:ribosomal protein S12 methylthiotransferase